MSEELKNCPFCGNSDLIETSNGEESAFIECESCGASGPCGIRWIRRDMWNTRQPDAKTQAVIEAARNVVDAGQHTNEECAWYDGFSCSCGIPKLNAAIRNLDKNQ